MFYPFSGPAGDLAKDGFTLMGDGNAGEGSLEYSARRCRILSHAAHVTPSNTMQTVECKWKIEQANQTGKTGFGSLPRPHEPRKRSVTLRQSGAGPRDAGHPGPRESVWTLNGDGTATSEESGQMWIQAPWGMEWEGGGKFLGAPCLLTWVEAKDLFGCGVRADLAPNGTIGLSREEIRATRPELGYKKGSCRVSFAGFDDWHLPTLEEWYSVLGLSRERRGDVLQIGYDQYYWSSTERHEPVHESRFKFFNSGHGCAWSTNADRWILDSMVETRLPVMFVRAV